MNADKASRPQGLSSDERMSLQFALSQPLADDRDGTVGLGVGNAAKNKVPGAKRDKYVSLQEFVAISRKLREDALLKTSDAAAVAADTIAPAAVAAGTAIAPPLSVSGDKEGEKKRDKYMSVSDYLKGSNALPGDTSSSSSSSSSNANSKQKNNIIADINIKTQKKKSAKMVDRKIDISDFDFSFDKKEDRGRGGRQSSSSSGNRKQT